MDKIFLIAVKEVKRRILSSIVIGIIFGLVSSFTSYQFMTVSPTLSLGISILVLNLALFLLGARIFSEEYTNKTLEYLLSLPIRDVEIVVGKYLGLFILVIPAVATDFIVSSYGVAEGGPPVFNFDYLTALTLYMLYSSSLMILVSSQFRRIPAIFIAYLGYSMILAIPSSFWLTINTLTSDPAPIFPIFLLILPFFTPLIIGVIEFVASKMPMIISQTIEAGGPGSIVIMFKYILGDHYFHILNIFLPIWHVSTITLKGSDFFNVAGYPFFYGFLSTFLTVCLMIYLTTLQVRDSKKRAFLLYLLASLAPTLPGFILPISRIDLR